MVFFVLDLIGLTFKYVLSVKGAALTFVVIFVVVAREFESDGAVGASPAISAGAAVHSIFQKTLAMTGTAVWTTSCVH